MATYKISDILNLHVVRVVNIQADNQEQAQQLYIDECEREGKPHGTISIKRAA